MPMLADPDYFVGYLKGAYRGDGHLVNAADGSPKTWTIRICDKSFAEAIRSAARFAFGVELKCREAIVPKTGKEQFQFNWTPKSMTLELLQPPIGSEQRRGYVGGFYDAEGWCTYGEVKIAQRKRAPLDLVSSILDEYKLPHRMYEQVRPETDLVPGRSWLLTVWSGQVRTQFFHIFEPKKGR